MLARRPGWDRMPLLDPPTARDGAGRMLCVLAEVDGEVRGYARYSVKPSWSSAGPDSTVKLSDIEALDPVVYAALWRFLTSIDLTSRVAFHNRPIDDPLLHLVADVRRCELSFRDSLHVRLVDLGEALEARAYAAPVDVVLEVEDAFCPWNAGRWRLAGDAKGATCERTTDPADLALSVKELGAAYLGGHTLLAQADAGKVRELRTGALAEASTAFGSDRLPWLPHGF
jgi:predicted acetyltransferase